MGDPTRYAVQGVDTRVACADHATDCYTANGGVLDGLCVQRSFRVRGCLLQRLAASHRRTLLQRCQHHVLAEGGSEPLADHASAQSAGDDVLDGR